MYRPFTRKEAEERIGTVIIEKERKVPHIITSVWESDIGYAGSYVSFEELLGHFTDKEGNPMGIKIEGGE